MYLLVGLGNPGKEYEKTRHNIGFMIIDNIVNEYGFTSDKSQFKAIVNTGDINNSKIILLKPTTFMNRSGISVAEAAKFYKIPLSNIIVFHDDIDLETGKVKIKVGGGHGGHNGLRDIDLHIGKEYKRVRIGIGHPGDKDKVSGYVLNNFLTEEEPKLKNLIISIAKNMNYVLNNDDALFTQNLVR